MQKTQQVPLDYPLPNRNWKQGENGLWHSKEWTPEEKRKAEEGRYKLKPIKTQ